jgi:hypothetical protein
MLRGKARRPRLLIGMAVAGAAAVLLFVGYLRVSWTVAATSDGAAQTLLYQSSKAAYDARLHDAVFLVTGTPADGAGYRPQDVPAAAVLATFGAPGRVYRYAGYTVSVWNVNLLTRFGE